MSRCTGVEPFICCKNNRRCARFYRAAALWSKRPASFAGVYVCYAGAEWLCATISSIFCIIGCSGTIALSRTQGETNEPQLPQSSSHTGTAWLIACITCTHDASASADDTGCNAHQCASRAFFAINQRGVYRTDGTGKRAAGRGCLCHSTGGRNSRCAGATGGHQRRAGYAGSRAASDRCARVVPRAACLQRDCRARHRRSG